MTSRWVRKLRNIDLKGLLAEVKKEKLLWFAKRLSGNDTNVTGGHQVGIYIPRTIVQVLSPRTDTARQLNPDRIIDEAILINDDTVLTNRLRLIYYNNKHATATGTRDEFRITCWGGKTVSVQDPERTGSILFFVWKENRHALHVATWVTKNALEEDAIEAWIGDTVLPGEFILPFDRTIKTREKRIDLTRLPREWCSRFPSGREVYSFVRQHADKKLPVTDPDKALLWGRQAEFSVFKALEERIVGPVLAGKSLSVDELVRTASEITNRRKSRSGRSLELHLAGIFSANSLEFQEQVVTEGKKKPDFLFPSGNAYHTSTFPAQGLHMLAAKSCCKDRWRQVINEADRIGRKHLFTLQEGVSGYQMDEMDTEGIQLVVPRQNTNSFPRSHRRKLLSLREFVALRKKTQERFPG